MEIFTYEGITLLVRWAHILAGITWIGLLYYFNFVQGAFFAETAPEVKGAATRQLVPRALWWFRYGALITFLAGLVLITMNARGGAFGDYLTSPYMLRIGTGMLLGLIMFLNVWLVIWPNQQIVIASAEKVAAGGEADPAAGDAGRRGLLASRTNVLFSIPMVFFMAAGSHLGLLVNAGGGGKWLYFIGGLVLIGAIELNALKWNGGAPKGYLETVRNVITAGFVFWVVLYALAEIADAI